MPIPLNSEAAQLYVGFMEEIKACLRSAIRAQDDTNGKAFFELFYLSDEYVLIQLRMILESLALACAIAHDGVVNIRSKTFQEKDYSADALFHKLADKNASFFPVAVSITVIDGHIRVDDNSTANMTREEVESIYTYCLNNLHRDKLKNVLKGKQKIYDRIFMRESLDRLCKFLNNHMIQISREDTHALIRLSNPGFRPEWQWMVRAP